MGHGGAASYPTGRRRRVLAAGAVLALSACHQGNRDLKLADSPPAQVAVAYADGFSDSSSGWPVSSAINYEYGYGSGPEGKGYAIRVDGGAPVVQVFAPRTNLPHNVRVDVDAAATGEVGPKSDGNIGLACRYTVNTYVFQIGGGGYYGIYKYRGLEKQRSLSDSLRRGPNRQIRDSPGLNHLVVLCTTSGSSTTLGLYVNGKPVAAATDDDPLTGSGPVRVGLRVEPGREQTNALFSRLAVATLG